MSMDRLANWRSRRTARRFVFELAAIGLALAAAIACLLAGDKGVPGRLAMRLIGPPRNPPRGSAPPWMEIDIAVMGLGLFGICIASLGLVCCALADWRWRRHRRAGT